MIQKNRMNTRVLGTKLLFLAGIKNRLSQGEHHSAQYWTSDGSQGVLYYRNGFFAIRMEFIEAEGVLSFRAALYNIIFREDAKICQYEGDVSLIKNKSKKNIESHAKKLSEEFKKEISKRGLYIGALSFIGAEGETTLAGYKKFIPFGTQLREFSKGCLYLMVSLQRQWLLCPDDWRIQMTEGVRGDQLKIEVRVPPVGNLTKETLFESFVGVYNEGKTKLCGPVLVRCSGASFYPGSRFFIESQQSPSAFWSETLMCFLMLLVHQVADTIRREMMKKET